MVDEGDATTTMENTVFRQLNEQELTFVSGGILGITLNKQELNTR